MIRALALLLALVLAPPGLAVQPDEVLDDPRLEERARDISSGLRCLVCQNETIDASNAPVARDLRLLVRERLVAGDTDDEVFAYVQARYGDFVLFNPPWKPSTYLLWTLPFAIMLVAALAFAMFLRRRARPQPVAATRLTEEEERAFARLRRGVRGGSHD